MKDFCQIHALNESFQNFVNIVVAWSDHQSHIKREISEVKKGLFSRNIEILKREKIKKVMEDIGVPLLKCDEVDAVTYLKIWCELPVVEN